MLLQAKQFMFEQPTTEPRVKIQPYKLSSPQ